MERKVELKFGEQIQEFHNTHARELEMGRKVNKFVLVVVENTFFSGTGE